MFALKATLYTLTNLYVLYKCLIYASYNSYLNLGEDDYDFFFQTK